MAKAKPAKLAKQEKAKPAKSKPFKKPTKK